MVHSAATYLRGTGQLDAPYKLHGPNVILPACYKICFAESVPEVGSWTVAMRDGSRMDRKISVAYTGRRNDKSKRSGAVLSGGCAV